MNKKKIFVTSLILLGVILLVVSFILYFKVLNSPSIDTISVKRFKGMKISHPYIYGYSNDGLLRSTITGKTVFFSHENDNIFGESIIIHHFDQSGKIEYKLIAEKVQGNLMNHDFELSGKIQVSNLKNIIIKTEKAHFFGEKQEIQAPSQVLVDIGQHHINARSAIVKILEQKVEALEARLELFAHP